MNEEQLYRRLGRILWDIAGVETGANVAFGLLLQSPALRDEDRRYLIERVRPEERGHDRMMSTWGRAWAGPRPRRRLPYSSLVWRDLVAAVCLDPAAKFAFTFATIFWNETNTLRSQRLVLSVLDRAGAEAARDFRQLTAEEAGHVTWERATLARLEREEPTLVKMVERYYDYTAAVYPAVVNRSHSRDWLLLDRALGP